MTPRVYVSHFSSPDFLVRRLPMGAEIVKTSNGSTRVVVQAVADAFVLAMLEQPASGPQTNEVTA